MPLSPYDFQNQYKSLSGSAIPPKGSETNRFTFANISCDRYVMTNNTEFTEAQPLLDKIAVNTVGRKLNDAERQALFNTRYGKGSPSEMTTVLQLAIETGAAKPELEELRKFAAKALGVDCTGFASSYYEQFEGSITGRKTNLGCGFFYQAMKSRELRFIWAGDYASRGDCLLWMYADGTESRKPGHIAVIENGDGNTITAVQSGSTASGGPRRSQHLIEEIVHRRVGKNDEPYYLRLQEIDPVSGRKAEVIIIEPFYVS